MEIHISDTISVIFSDLPKDILFLIFTNLPINYIQILYYDKKTKSYWFNFPVRLTHNFWTVKACKDFMLTEQEFNYSHAKGYNRYAEILSRTGLCSYSTKFITTDLFLLRAAKQDNLKLFKKGMSRPGIKKVIQDDFIYSLVCNSGHEVLNYCINTEIIKMKKEYSNHPNIKAALLRDKEILNYEDLLNIKLAKKETVDLLDILNHLTNLPASFWCLGVYFSYINEILKLLSVNEILELVKHHVKFLHLYQYMMHLISEEHECKYGCSIDIETATILWLKTGKICCLIKKLNSELRRCIRLSELDMVKYLTEKDASNILKLLDRYNCSSANNDTLEILLYYPNLLHQYKNWIEPDIPFDYHMHLYPIITSKDKLEGYRNLIFIAKEIGYKQIPFVNFSSEIKLINTT
jgi:hypothetical protein